MLSVGASDAPQAPTLMSSDKMSSFVPPFESVHAASSQRATRPNILSLSTEFPNPSEPSKGLFVRSRLLAMASLADVTVVAPVPVLDYANPHNRLFASFDIPPHRSESGLDVIHPRWLYPPYGGWLNAFCLFLRLIWPFARFRKHRRFDVIDAHFAHPEGIAAALLSAAVGVPFLVTLRGSELRYRHSRFKRFWMAWAIRRANRVVAVSDGLKNLAIEFGAEPKRVHTIPNGVDSEIFFPHDKDAGRRKLGLPTDERIILTAGDLAELKGHHRVIAAVKQLNGSDRRVSLLIAGGVGRSGRYAAALRQQVAHNQLTDRVRFLGEVEQRTLAELMSVADVFCLASSSEGWPNVVNEALACGTPVVATDVGAVRQMIPTDRYGLVVPVEDPTALEDALRSALERPWDRSEISSRGRARSWSTVAEEVIHEIRQVVPVVGAPGTPTV